MIGQSETWNACLVVLALVVTVSLGVLGVFALREAVLRMGRPALLRGLIELAWPVPGMYAHNIVGEIDLGVKGARLEAVFAHKYVGPYVLGVVVPYRLLSVTPSSLPCVLALAASAPGQHARLWNLGDDISPWWTKEGNGFALLRYEIPADFPAQAIVSFSITVTSVLDPNNSEPGQVKVYIGRESLN